MCTVVNSPTCSCSSPKSEGSGLMAAFGGCLLIVSAGLAAVGPTAIIGVCIAAGIVVMVSFGPTRKALWWVVTHLLAPAVAMTAVCVSLWLAGKPFTPRSADRRHLSGATWLRAGSKVISRTRTGAHWYAWAGWQRTATRTAMLGVGAAAWWSPAATAATLSVLMLTAAGRIIAVQLAERRNAGDTIRVRAVVGKPVRTVGASTELAFTSDDVVEGVLTEAR